MWVAASFRHGHYKPLTWASIQTQALDVGMDSWQVVASAFDVVMDSWQWM